MFAPNERRQTPLIVVASDNGAAAEALVAQLRSEGAVAYATRGAQGCLRMATSIAPDYVLLDSALAPRVEKMLRAHPASAGADIMRWSNGHLSEHLPWSAPQPASPTPVFHLAAA